MQKNIGEKIKKNRIMKEYTQVQLASEMDVAPSALAAYESGKRIPKIEIREQISKILCTDPVDLSGLELSEDDEIRLLNKLLIKYCKNMQIKQEAGSGSGCVEIILPSSFSGLEEQYRNYQDAVKEGEFINSLSDEDDRWETPLEENSYLQEAKAELDFWLDTWPEYDYQYQMKKNEENPFMGRHSFKERLQGKFLDKFYQFKETYLDRKV